MLATVVEELSRLDDDALTERFRDLELLRRRLDAEMAVVVDASAGTSRLSMPITR